MEKYIDTDQILDHLNALNPEVKNAIFKDIGREEIKNISGIYCYHNMIDKIYILFKLQPEEGGNLVLIELDQNTGSEDNLNFIYQVQHSQSIAEFDKENVLKIFLSTIESYSQYKQSIQLNEVSYRD